MKKASLLALLLALALLLSSCTGFNPIMRAHLGDPENYRSCCVTLVDAYDTDPQTGERIRDFSSEQSANADIVWIVQFDSYDDVAAFLGISDADESVPLSDYTFYLQIIAENNRQLWKNGFYEEVPLNQTVEIHASDFIYMDGRFFYIAQVRCSEKEYLDLATGVKNMKRMMNRNKSLL